MSVADDEQLLQRFVAAFRRGIEGEIAALSSQSTAAELVLSRGEELGALRYAFDLSEASDKLAPGADYTLRTPRGERRVAVEHLDGLRITVAAQQPIDLEAHPIHLVITPWFLYERLIQALERIAIDHHAVDLAFTLFGKRPPVQTSAPLQREHGALNPSQRAAVQLCSDSNLAFVWGPPGTGKTVTLTCVIDELRAQKKRILLTSTTNAAIDQVLAVLARAPWFASALQAGDIVRLGRSEEETFGTELAEVTSRKEATRRRSIDRLQADLTRADQALQTAAAVLADLARAAAPQQSLFAEPPARAGRSLLASIFPAAIADAVARMPAREQGQALERRQARLTRYRELVKARVHRHREALRDSEAQVLRRASLVMSTLATSYLSPGLKDLRFDVLIAEEAGMAPLPALFHAAALCREKAIAVGDPRQLPPILQARDPQVQRAIGRSVFDVTIPDPHRSEVVALLDIQYRMHPAIGTLVGQLFYEGRLTHRADPARSEAIAARAPYRGHPLIVLDTRSGTTCERASKGSSRVNPTTAELIADLAVEAAAESAGSIAVITPYAAQAQDIRRRLARRKLQDAVDCSTIHRFQGRESDLVLLDLVDAAPMRPGLLLAGSGLRAEAANLLNVSVSRARGKLIIVADVGYFERESPRSIVTELLHRAARDGLPVPWEPAVR